MNSARRIIDILEKIQEQKTYFDACKTLFKTSNTYEQLYFYKYFLSDLKNIEKVLKKTGKYKEHIHKEKLGAVAICISPNYLTKGPLTQQQIHLNDFSKKTNSVSSSIEFMEILESFLPDETLYDKEIEDLKLALKDRKKTNSPLDDILDDIDEAVFYYGYFGNIVIEDKFHKVLGNTIINIEKLKPAIKKFPIGFKIIVNFFDFYKKIKEVKEQAPALIEDIKKTLGAEDDTTELEIIDSE